MPRAHDFKMEIALRPGFVLSVLLFVALQSAAVAQDRAPGTVFKDCADCPEMVVIPAGRFVMGTAPGEEEREGLSSQYHNRSQPGRQVKVGRFSAGKFEVTRGQYRAFAEATGRGSDGCFIWAGTDFEKDEARDWRNPGYAQDDTHPVACVSWDDASAYARWLSQKTGRAYRLLTEAEWEYVARAGTTTTRYWGDAGDMSCGYANSADLTTRAQVRGASSWDTVDCSDRYAYTAPVGSYRANAFGLHDMLGNVWEWTQDCWNENYSGAPTDGSAWTSGNCFLRVGSWEDGSLGVRAAYRVGSPVVIRVHARGFRIARSD
jgi:sulfatase modifying factor 1